MGHEHAADEQRDLALAVSSSHPYSRAVTHVWAAILAFERGDPARLKAHLHALGSVDDTAAQIQLAIRAFAAYLDLLEGRAAALSRLRAVRDAAVGGEAPAPALPGVMTRVLLAGYAFAGDSRAGLALANQALVMGRG